MDAIRKIFAQVVLGLDYIHSQGFVHRDINLKVNLTDFRIF